MNLKKLMERLKKNKNALEVNVPKLPTKKQVIRSRRASNPTHKDKMQE